MVTAQLSRTWFDATKSDRGIADHLGPDGELYDVHGPEADHVNGKYKHADKIRGTQFNATELGKVWK